MTYYILLEGDSTNDIWDDNILGEESFEKFYAGNGFIAFDNIINKKPEALETVRIIDEQNNSYSVEQFLELISKWKIMS
mgnify:CR=1 FL=1|tara:strand:- start:2329 stop:2565 length:237 start_codon:yes stop_codon:yes gene_type:complete